MVYSKDPLAEPEMWQLRLCPAGVDAGKWSALKKALQESTQVLSIPAVERLNDVQWLEARAVGVDLLALLESTEDGIGSRDGPRVSFDLTYTACDDGGPFYRDIVVIFFGKGWTPELVHPYRLALEESVVLRLLGLDSCSLEQLGKERIRLNLDVRLEWKDGSIW